MAVISSAAVLAVEVICTRCNKCLYIITTTITNNNIESHLGKKQQRRRQQQQQKQPIICTRQHTAARHCLNALAQNCPSQVCPRAVRWPKCPSSVEPCSPTSRTSTLRRREVLKTVVERWARIETTTTTMLTAAIASKASDNWSLVFWPTHCG